MHNNIFNANADAAALRTAMRGVGTDEDTLINVLAHKTADQIKQIKQAYSSQFPGRDLARDIQSETSFNFKTVLVRLLQDPVERDAVALKQSMAGLGTNDRALIEILVTRSDSELEAIKAYYQQAYHKTLEDDVKGDTSGDYRALLLQRLNVAQRLRGPYTQQQAEADAMAIYRAGEGKLGTNEKKFIEIFGTRTPEQIEMIDRAYNVMRGYGLRVAIDKETSGNFRRALHALAASPALYFVELLHAAFKGIGTDDNVVISIMTCSTALRMMHEICHLYQFKYRKSLIDALRSETSGDYRKVLVALASRPKEINLAGQPGQQGQPGQPGKQQNLPQYQQAPPSYGNQASAPPSYPGQQQGFPQQQQQQGYPQQQQQGYPQQQQGYPQQPQGYPQQQQGYPQQQGQHPPQQGYPQQPQQKPQQPQAYPQAYPQQQQSYQQYPQQPATGGYPQPTSTYPGSQASTTYPPSVHGYPQQGPPAQPLGGSGYPQSGYPSSGYPPATGPNPFTDPAYQQQPTDPGYPTSSAYPPAGFPPAGFPPADPGYPPASGPGYPASGPGYPTSGPGYPPASGPGYPASGPGYPASGPGYPGY